MHARFGSGHCFAVFAATACFGMGASWAALCSRRREGRFGVKDVRCVSSSKHTGVVFHMGGASYHKHATEALAQDAQRSCGCPKPGSVEGQVGCLSNLVQCEVSLPMAAASASVVHFPCEIMKTKTISRSNSS
ncbi:uncharacterized protein AAGF69_003882 isoform 2-T2 [Amazona ochrocephala]